MDYLWLKWIHIISSTILFGTGIGTAFFMFMANQRKEPGHINFATRHVVIADWLFTTPAVIIQLITGIALVMILDLDFTRGWVLWALLLYFLTGALWLPVVWIQIKMRQIAKGAFEKKEELPARYWHLEKWWTGLGTLAFPVVVMIFYLMVFKPEI